MRALRGLFCAVALMACLAPGARADEYTKQTFLTFSGPVQLPGIVLPAGTYQFRLADPDSGRRVLQVWDKDGNKLLTTLLTIPDQRMTPASEPVVMFSERPSGEPQAVRAWFYPNESYGQEFVYPKEQAMKIAKDTHKDVLSYEGDAKDEAAFKAAKVGRVDENGTVTDANKADATAAASPSTAQSASTTTASSASTTTADNSAKSDAAASSAPSRPSQTASDNTGSAAMPSANRSGAPAAVGTSGTTIGNSTSEANRDNTNVNERAVGSTGTTASANSANRTAQAAAGANAAAPRAGQSNTASAAPARELPRTASSTVLVQLLAALSLAAAVGLRVFRARAAESR